MFDFLFNSGPLFFDSGLLVGGGSYNFREAEWEGGGGGGGGGYLHAFVMLDL